MATPSANYISPFSTNTLISMNSQQFGVKHASEEWKSADLPRNLQQFGMKNVPEEWKSADFLRNLQQFRTKNPRNSNNFFGGNVTFLTI
jgi:hypothetical protein